MKNTTNENKIYYKPFNDTGNCGYGDSCKYLHVRENRDNNCSICNSNTQLLVSECYHYYCYDCSIKIYTENKCRICNMKINGIFKYL